MTSIRAGDNIATKVLWLDKVAHASHPETWLELDTDDVESAAAALVAAISRRTGSAIRQGR